MTKVSGYLRGNVLGLVAIFIALTAGAYAADKAGKNTVVSKSIKDGQVKGADLAADSVDSSKIAQNALTGEDINETSLTGVPGDGNSGGTVKSVQTGAGLTGGPIVNSGTVALQSCPNGQLLKSNGTGYACGADNGGTSYGAVAGGGLALTGTDFRLAPCSNNQILKSNGAGYACAADVDTNTTYTAGSGLALAGTSFSVAPGGVDAGKLAANSVTTTKLADNAITGAKVADGSLTQSDISSPMGVLIDLPNLPQDNCLVTFIAVPTDPNSIVLAQPQGAIPPPNPYAYQLTVNGLIFEHGGLPRPAVRFCNQTAAAVDPPAQPFTVLVISP